MYECIHNFLFHFLISTLKVITFFKYTHTLQNHTSLKLKTSHNFHNTTKPQAINKLSKRQRLLNTHSSLSKSLGYDESKLQWLRRIEPWVTMGVVTWAEVIKCHGSWTTNTFGHILTRHFKMNTSRMASFLLMHIKECSHFRLLQQHIIRLQTNDTYSFKLFSFFIKLIIRANETSSLP